MIDAQMLYEAASSMVGRCFVLEIDNKCTEDNHAPTFEKSPSQNEQ